jgi:oligoendopeptidase F
LSSEPIVIADSDRWEGWAPHFALLEAYPLDSQNVNEWLHMWSDLSAVLTEESTKAGRAHDENTADKEAEARYFRFIGDVWPQAEVASQVLRNKLLSLPRYEAQANQTEFLKRLRTTSEMYREENVKLDAEIGLLASEYNTSVGALTIPWEGREQTLPQAALSLQNSDRAVREEVWRKIHSRWKDVDDQFDTLYLNLRSKRQLVARNASFANFRDYVWSQNHRFDYTPGDISSLRGAIETEWKPLAADVLRDRQSLLKLNELKPWDLEVDAYGKEPLRPFDGIDKLIGKTQVVLGKISPEFGGQFGAMIPDYLDLTSRPNKSPGGYLAFFPVTGMPYIFMNAAGTQNDVNVLLHEAGHAMHALAAHRAQPLIFNTDAPMEFCEVGSMAMELLAFPYYEAANGGFYDDPAAANRAKREQIEKIVLFLPYMAVVDEFQEWVYVDAPNDVSALQLDDRWGSIWEKYMPVVDWTGLFDIRNTGWHRKQHIFNSPFYYIEYGLAQLGALQVWQNSTVDHAGAVNQYKAALALGGTRGARELFATAGAEFPTRPEVLSKLVTMLRTELAK